MNLHTTVQAVFSGIIDKYQLHVEPFDDEGVFVISPSITLWVNVDPRDGASVVALAQDAKRAWYCFAIGVFLVARASTALAYPDLQYEPKSRDERIEQQLKWHVAALTECGEDILTGTIEWFKDYPWAPTPFRKESTVNKLRWMLLET